MKQKTLKNCFIAVTWTLLLISWLKSHPRFPANVKHSALLFGVPICLRRSIVSVMIRCEFLTRNKIWWMKSWMMKSWMNEIMNEWNLELWNHGWWNHGWLNHEWMKSWMNEIINEWNHELMKSWINEIMNWWNHELMKLWINEIMNEWYCYYVCCGSYHMTV